MAGGCSIQCSVRDGSPSMLAQFEDGSQLDIPEELINSSQILQDALSTAGEAGEFTLAAPSVEWLQAWADCASAAPDLSRVDTDHATLGLLVRLVAVFWHI